MKRLIRSAAMVLLILAVTLAIAADKAKQLSTTRGRTPRRDRITSKPTISTNRLTTSNPGI